MKASCGLKTAPQDYQEELAKRLCSLGFVRLVMCSCIYVLGKQRELLLCMTTSMILSSLEAVVQILKSYY